jgi:hypothetical protein
VALSYTDHYVGVLDYLMGLMWAGDGVIKGEGLFAASAFEEPLPAAEGDKVFMNREAAHNYLENALISDMEKRSIGNGRRRTLSYKMTGLKLFTDYAAGLPAEELEVLKQQWSLTQARDMAARTWSPEQQNVLDRIEEGIQNTDPDRPDTERWLHIKGRPGSGKSEVLAYAAVAAAKKGAAVLILCPTGTLLCSYRERISSDRIDIETLHSAFVIRREADEVVNYAPPTRLRRYDLILMDEASQVEDGVFSRVVIAIRELPQRPMVCIAADMQQLRPVGSGDMMSSLLQKIVQVELKTIYRSSDPAHLLFLNKIRDAQPEKTLVAEYFRGRQWTGDLMAAVKRGLEMQTSIADAFMWLTVSNKGAARVNEAALQLRGISPRESEGYRADPNVTTDRIVPRPGILVRLTRNMDKTRGFVNGAIGEIVSVFDAAYFTVRLKTGTMILMHPICGSNERAFLPLTYGWATTIRRAQGMSLTKGCIFFDLPFPPERGYAYVAVSRFRSRAGVFHFGRYRRTDWLPVGGVSTEQTARGLDSMSSDSFEGPESSDEETDGIASDTEDEQARGMFDDASDSREDEEDIESDTVDEAASGMFDDAVESDAVESEAEVALL